jgi:hypothetical protein
MNKNDPRGTGFSLSGFLVLSSEWYDKLKPVPLHSSKLAAEKGPATFLADEGLRRKGGAR